MALWGNSDNLVIAGAPSSVDVVGTASSDFWTAAGTDINLVPTGTTILLDLLGGEPGVDGFVVVESYLSANLAKVGKMSAVAAGTYEAAYCNQPISLKNDPGYAPASPDGELDRSQVVAGISTAGVDAAGLTTTTGGFHAGWVGIMTYVDMHGNLRNKTETFVAASGIQTGNRPYPA
jgi:hypothetical protein